MIKNLHICTISTISTYSVIGNAYMNMCCYRLTYRQLINTMVMVYYSSTTPFKTVTRPKLWPTHGSLHFFYSKAWIYYCWCREQIELRISGFFFLRLSRILKRPASKHENRSRPAYTRVSKIKTRDIVSSVVLFFSVNKKNSKKKVKPFSSRICPWTRFSLWPLSLSRFVVPRR